MRRLAHSGADVWGSSSPLKGRWEEDESDVSQGAARCTESFEECQGRCEWADEQEEER